MAIQNFERLISNTSTVFLSTDREQAAMNAANNIGGASPDLVPRNSKWPSLQKFDNDTAAAGSSTPFRGVLDPMYIWDQPTTDGQTVAFAIASSQFLESTASENSFSVFLVAFAENAMEAKIELFEQIGSTQGSWAKVSSQPEGLGDFLFVAGEPNNPAVGLTINNPPFTFQNIRVSSTRFTVPSRIQDTFYKIVVSFKVTNYLIKPQYASNPPSLNNPAGLQFIVDIYRNIETA